MPLYEYRCQECGELFEILQTVDADARGVRCPACGTQRAKRQLSTFAASTSSSDAPSSRPGCGSGFT
ncbi:MAG: zinc ribbon domain-containing protein [Thermoanaerobaculia bacterium]|nr:zinc ribbon domain-containing protein [Thermoanaerobaculia bacterium]